MQNLTKELKQPPTVILQQAIFYNIFILCLWLRIIRISDQGVSFMNFPSQMFFNYINHGYRGAILKKNYLWLLPFYIAVATYFYYEKLRRTMRTAIVSYQLKLIRAYSRTWGHGCDFFEKGQRKVKIREKREKLVTLYKTYTCPGDIKILGLCLVGPVLPHREKMSFYPWLVSLLVMVPR